MQVKARYIGQVWRAGRGARKVTRGTRRGRRCAESDAGGRDARKPAEPVGDAREAARQGPHNFMGVGLKTAAEATTPVKVCGS